MFKDTCTVGKMLRSNHGTWAPLSQPHGRPGLQMTCVKRGYLFISQHSFIKKKKKKKGGKFNLCFLVDFWLRQHGPIFMPRHQKVAGYYVIPSEILSVRPSVCLSVRPSVHPSVHPSVRPSAPTTILVSATPPTVLGQSFWNFTGVLWMVWRYAYCFFRILKLFLSLFSHF